MNQAMWQGQPASWGRRIHFITGFISIAATLSLMAVRTDEHLYDELKRLKKDVARLTEKHGKACPERVEGVRMDSGAERGL
jgi:hypothetical protein